MNPIIMRDIEVTSIDPILRTFDLVVHVKATPLQMHTPGVEAHISDRVHYAVRYLVEEGFIPDPMNENWRCTIAGKCHEG